jgi:hypothetical protein
MTKFQRKGGYKRQRSQDTLKISIQSLHSRYWAPNVFTKSGKIVMGPNRWVSFAVDGIDEAAKRVHIRGCEQHLVKNVFGCLRNFLSPRFSVLRLSFTYPCNQKNVVCTQVLVCQTSETPILREFHPPGAGESLNRALLFSSPPGRNRSGQPENISMITAANRLRC